MRRGPIWERGPKWEPSARPKFLESPCLRSLPSVKNQYNFSCQMDTFDFLWEERRRLIVEVEILLRVKCPPCTREQNQWFLTCDLRQELHYPSIQHHRTTCRLFLITQLVEKYSVIQHWHNCVVSGSHHIWFVHNLIYHNQHQLSLAQASRFH